MPAGLLTTKNDHLQTQFQSVHHLLIILMFRFIWNRHFNDIASL